MTVWLLFIQDCLNAENKRNAWLCDCCLYRTAWLLKIKGMHDCVNVVNKVNAWLLAESSLRVSNSPHFTEFEFEQSELGLTKLPWELCDNVLDYQISRHYKVWVRAAKTKMDWQMSWWMYDRVLNYQMSRYYTVQIWTFRTRLYKTTI